MQTFVKYFSFQKTLYQKIFIKKKLYNIKYADFLNGADFFNDAGCAEMFLYFEVTHQSLSHNITISLAEILARKHSQPYFML